jgi:NAD-dependent DNA ligase
MGGVGSGGQPPGAGRPRKAITPDEPDPHAADPLPDRPAERATRSHFLRQGARYKNEFIQSAQSLVGIVTGLLADQRINDQEIQFLQGWLDAHGEVACAWPGDILHQRVKAALSDGIITEIERAHIVETLQLLIGGSEETAARANHVTELGFDDSQAIVFAGFAFCLTGDFVYAPREACEGEIIKRGGLVKSGVSKKVRYVVVGSLGSPEWKHGSYGTKIEKAMQLKQAGAQLAVVKEDVWAAAL